MPLQLRRGTDAQRVGYTPLVGELIYTTDTKNVYVGDGTTPGGIAITSLAAGLTGNLAGNVNLNTFAINGIGTVDIIGNISATGNINGTVIGSVSTAISNVKLTGGTSGQVVTTDGNGNLSFATVSGGGGGGGSGTVNSGSIRNLAYYASTGTAVSGLSPVNWNSVTSTLSVAGNVSITGNLFGSADIDGNFRGSLFSDNSSLVIDGITGHIYTKYMVSTTGDLIIDSQVSGKNQVKIITEDGRTVLKLSRKSTSNLNGDTTLRYGAIFFERDDISGPLTTSGILAGENYIHFSATTTGNLTNDNTNIFAWTDKKLGIGTIAPAATLDVRGSGIFTGTVSAASFKGSVFADDSTVIVDAINSSISASKIDVNGNGVFGGTVNAASFKGSVVGDDSTVIVDAINSTIAVSGFIQFGSYSKTDRDNLGASNGMVLYNTTSNRFQGYQNGAWINLDDGTADP